MLYFILLLVAAALAGVVAALITANSLWAWVSVALSVLALVFLGVDWLRRRSRHAAAEDSTAEDSTAEDSTGQHERDGGLPQSAEVVEEEHTVAGETGVIADGGGGEPEDPTTKVLLVERPPGEETSQRERTSAGQDTTAEQWVPAVMEGTVSEDAHGTVESDPDGADPDGADAQDTDAAEPEPHGERADAAGADAVEADAAGADAAGADAAGADAAGADAVEADAAGATTDGSTVTGDPGEEPTDPAAGRAVAALDDEVVVVDEYPRYHLGRCGWLADRETIPISVSEARDLGFTPCARCAPDAALLSGPRKRRGRFRKRAHS